MQMQMQINNLLTLSNFTDDEHKQHQKKIRMLYISNSQTVDNNNLKRRRNLGS